MTVTEVKKKHTLAGSVQRRLAEEVPVRPVEEEGANQVR
jgi:hypothetical protein